MDCAQFCRAGPGEPGNSETKKGSTKGGIETIKIWVIMVDYCFTNIDEYAMGT